MVRGSILSLGAALLSTLLLVGTGDAVASSSRDGASEREPTPTALERADRALGTIEVRSIRVQRWLRDARVAKDAPRIRCLDRLLSQAHAVERLARRDVVRVSHAAAHDADDVVRRKLARLELFEERSRTLADKAYWCGKARSQRVKLPTTYRVRVIKPRLPELTLRPSSEAAGWR